MAYILVAEDEIPINDLICKNLKLLGFCRPRGSGACRKRKF